MSEVEKTKKFEISITYLEDDNEYKKTRLLKRCGRGWG